MTTDAGLDVAVERVMQPARLWRAAWVVLSHNENEQNKTEMREWAAKLDSTIRTELAQQKQEGRKAALEQEYDRGCPAPCHCAELSLELEALAEAQSALADEVTM